MTTDEDRERARKAWYETDGCNDNGAIEHLAEALASTRAEALDFETWWKNNPKLHPTAYANPGFVWRAAIADQAKRLADETRRERLAVEHANGFAACREMAAKVAEGTLGWSEAGDTRAQTIAAAIRALIAPDETENHK